MPASRTCTKCGAALPGAVRWCGQCYEAVREFTPRAPIHQGDFVDAPRITSNVSRWQASETTFGPAGRLAVTALLGVVVAGATWFAMSSVIFVVALIPGTSLVVWALRDIWRPVRTDLQAYRSPGVRVEDVASAVRPPSVRDIPVRRRAWLAAAAVGYAAVVLSYFRLPESVQMAFLGILAFAVVATILWRIVSR